MAMSEVVYHRDRSSFGSLASSPYHMDNVGYTMCCPKCDKAMSGISRKRSKSECLDKSKWKSNNLVASEPRMLRSSNRPLMTNSNTINKTEAHQPNSKLCDDCEESKNRYLVEMEELRRQLRQVGRNHYNGRNEQNLGLYSKSQRGMGSVNNELVYNFNPSSSSPSTARQLRPRRLLLPKIPTSNKFNELEPSPTSKFSVHNVINIGEQTGSNDNLETGENTRVLRKSIKSYRDSTSSVSSGDSTSNGSKKSLKNVFTSTSPPQITEKRSRPQKKCTPPNKVKCKTKKSPVVLQDEEMDVGVGVGGSKNTSPPNSSRQSALSVATDMDVDMNNRIDIKKSSSLDLANIHQGVRLSLFSNIPPYIRFSYHDDPIQAYPSGLAKHMKWKLSPITPVVVRKTILSSGFKLVRKSSEWCGTWGKHMKSLSFRTLKESQKINHFPGTFQIGRKDRLWKNLMKCMMKFGEKEFGFTPRTYVLPGDDKLLRANWERNCGNIKWIVKPPASARGVGIKVVHKWNQIPRKMPLVVQKYLDDPYLINDTKFDLRLYVLVTSFNPLRIYLYDNGLVRFASVKYSANSETLQDRYMHLTNYSINKLSASYTQNEDAEACQGHKWTLKSLWTYLEQEHKVDIAALQDSIVDVVIKTMICGEFSINQLTRTNQPSRYCSYELFGIDILLDSQLKPWLLEVNISPSLHSSSPLDLAVKGPLVKDLFNIAGFHFPDKVTAHCEEELLEVFGLPADTNLLYDKRLYTPLLSNEEREKHVSFVQVESRDDYLHTITQSLTPDDVRHLVAYEDELTQLGSFIKVFPTTTTHQYFPFFEGGRYYNMLFDAWEYAHHSNRSKGIKILEQKCQQGVHLDISQVNFKPTQTSPIPQSEEPSPTNELESDAVRSSGSKISLSCSATFCRPQKQKPRLRTYVTRRTSRRCSKASS